MRDMSMIVLFVGLSILIVALIVYFVFLRKNCKNINKTKYQAKWLKIQSSLDKDDSTTWAKAIVKADELFQSAFHKHNIKGSSVNERISIASNLWSNEAQIQSACKIASRLRKDDKLNLNQDVTKKIMLAYKQALVDLDAI